MRGVSRHEPRRYGWLIIFALTMVVYRGAAAQDDYAVVSFKLRGVEQLSEKALREALATKGRPWSQRFLFWKEKPRFDDEEFALDLLRIEKFYRLEGFIEARVDSHRIIANDRKRTVKLRVYVHEGRPLVVERVALRDLESAVPDEKSWRDLPKRLAMRQGRRWREADVNADVNRIAATLAIASFPYAQVKPTTMIDSTSFRVGIEYNVSPGPLCRFDSVRVEGLEQVPSTVVLRELKIAPGKRYNQSLLAEGQQSIYRLELFQFVSVRARDFERRATRIPVDVRVKEAPHNTVKLGVGYGTEDSYRASVNWRRRNFLGGGRRLESKLKSSGLEPFRVEMSLIQPHFLDRKTVAVFTPFFVREKEVSFKINRLGANVSVQRHFARYTDGFINYRFETDRIDADSLLSLQDQSAAEERTRNKSIGAFGMISNDSRPLFNPSQGGVNSITIEYSGDALGSKFPYWKVTVERRGYIGLAPGWVFAYRAKAGSMAPVGRAQVTPIEERFYAGGSASVRGWRRFKLGPLSDADQTPLGGNSLFEGSTELRYPIYKIFSGAVFIDFGNVWRGANTFVADELHYAGGVGLRFETPIGPIRFDVAGKLNKQHAAESTFEFHVSVGQAF